MRHYSIHHHFIIVYGQYKHQLERLQQTPGAKTLHDFRVVCKQLDAIHGWVLTFYSDNDVDEITKWFDQLKPFYIQGGKVRTRYMLLKVGKQLAIWSLLPELHLNLTAKYESALEYFAHQAHQFSPPFSRKIELLLKDREHHYDNSQQADLLNDFNQRQLTDALAHLQQPVSDFWHTARRLIKNSYFLMKDGNRISPGFSDDDKVALCAILEKELGRWHDLMVMLQYLQKHDCSQDVIDKKVMPAIRQIVASIEARIPLLQQFCQ